MNDLTKAIQLQPSARLYRHRGTLYFISEVNVFSGNISLHIDKDFAFALVTESYLLFDKFEFGLLGMS